MPSNAPEGASEAPSIRQQLRTGAFAHVREHGTGDLTVRTLANAAGRSTMCVYSKYGGRDALLDTVYDDAAAELRAHLDRSSPIDYLQSLRRWAVENPGLWQLLVTHDAGGARCITERRPDLLCGLQAELAALLSGPVELRAPRAVSHLCAVTGWLVVEGYAVDEGAGVSRTLMDESWSHLMAHVAESQLATPAASS